MVKEFKVGSNAMPSTVSGAKVALNMFMQDKTITSREKDLLKTLKVCNFKICY